MASIGCLEDGEDCRQSTMTGQVLRELKVTQHNWREVCGHDDGNLSGIYSVGVGARHELST